MGIFDSDVQLFATYHARLRFRDRIMGGIPKDPKIIESWLRTRTGIVDQDEEARRMFLRTLVELGADVRPDMSYEEIARASEHLASEKQTNGFKVDVNGPYLESRTVKACLKENTNILFASERWGATKKGPKAYVAERIFIKPDHLSFGVSAVNGVDLFIGHVSGPQGRQSNLTYYEYVTNAVLEFDVLVTEDAIKHDQWMRLWVQAQENGLGALRSQGFGRFDIEMWERQPK